MSSSCRCIRWSTGQTLAHRDQPPPFIPSHKRYCPHIYFLQLICAFESLQPYCKQQQKQLPSNWLTDNRNKGEKRSYWEEKSVSHWRRLLLLLRVVASNPRTNVLSLNRVQDTHFREVAAVVTAVVSPSFNVLWAHIKQSTLRSYLFDINCPFLMFIAAPFSECPLSPEDDIWMRSTSMKISFFRRFRCIFNTLPVSDCFYSCLFPAFYNSCRCGRVISLIW